LRDIYKMENRALPYGGTNDFCGWYSSEIKNNLNGIMNLVKTAPELAVRVFYAFHDRDVGLAFVARYQDSDEYHDSAYFIARDLGCSIQRQQGPSVSHKPPINGLIPCQDDSLGVGGPGMDRVRAVSELRHYIRTYDNDDPRDRWVEGNLWDDVIRAAEKLSQ